MLLLLSEDVVKTLKTALSLLGIDTKPTSGTAHTICLCQTIPSTNIFAIPQSSHFTEVFSQAFKSAHSTRLDRVSRLLETMEELGPLGRVGAVASSRDCSCVSDCTA